MKRRNRCKAKLRLYPDPILKAVCEPVGNDEDVSGIIRDMMYVLTSSKTGVGLAAPQAGHTKRVIIVKEGNFVYQVMINPEFADFEGRTWVAREMCLSYPGKSKDIERFTCIDVNYEDDNRNEQCDTYSGLDARIIQHEIDHLDGKCKVGE